jgi:predicted nucleic acid-binding protein
VIVLDASALLELVLETPSGRLIADRIADPATGLHAPHLIDLEVAQALRRYMQKREIGASDAAEALTSLHTLDLQRHAHEPLLERVWQLRDNLSACEAVYVALAEALDATLLTCDRPLSRAPGSGARVEYVDGWSSPR